jgi:hypothetical protein
MRRQPAKSPIPLRPRWPRFRFEHLEDRCVFSANSFAGVTGTDTFAAIANDQTKLYFVQDLISLPTAQVEGRSATLFFDDHIVLPGIVSTTDGNTVGISAPRTFSVPTTQTFELRLSATESPQDSLNYEFTLRTDQLTENITNGALGGITNGALKKVQLTTRLISEPAQMPQLPGTPLTTPPSAPPEATPTSTLPSKDFAGYPPNVNTLGLDASPKPQQSVPPPIEGEPVPPSRPAPTLPQKTRGNAVLFPPVTLSPFEAGRTYQRMVTSPEALVPGVPEQFDNGKPTTSLPQIANYIPVLGIFNDSTMPSSPTRDREQLRGPVELELASARERKPQSDPTAKREEELPVFFGVAIEPQPESIISDEAAAVLAQIVRPLPSNQLASSLNSEPIEPESPTPISDRSLYLFWATLIGISTSHFITDRTPSPARRELPRSWF